MSKPFKISKEDIPVIKAKLEAGIQIKDLAEEYEYYDGTAFKKAIKGMGYRITDTLVPLEDGE
tara:strand:- start:789 stop:977 length:189 start_codon:yes stop_codon:yes gene_type:complete